MAFSTKVTLCLLAAVAACRAQAGGNFAEPSQAADPSQFLTPPAAGQASPFFQQDMTAFSILQPNPAMQNSASFLQNPMASQQSSQNLQQTPQNFEQSPQNLEQTPQNFQQSSQNFQQEAANIQELPVALQPPSP